MVLSMNIKITSLLAGILLSAIVVQGQATSSSVELVTTYSENGRFYLKSVPYDNEFPSLRGKTSVYEKGRSAPLYVFERGFDSVGANSNNLILSNDGEVIFYVIPWGADEEKEGLKSISIYKQGKLVKSFTETEITGCDQQKERCSLFYSNFDEVVDKEKSNWGTRSYRKTFKDRVYLIDSNRKAHIFDLKEGSYLGADSFDNIFEQVKNRARASKTETSRYDAPTFLDFPKLKNGKDTAEALADYLGMKVVDDSAQKDEQYKWYSFKLSSNISRDGSLEIEAIEIYNELPKEKIIEFFKVNKFDISPVPAVFEKWYVGDEYFFFRNKDDRIARQEKEREKIEQDQEFYKRLTLERINGVYIPANLGECFVELDKLLPEVDKKEMQALPQRDGMSGYHMGLGMWMRNNWGLWGGSRLQKYFTDRGVTHPDDMSTVILYHYYDWLKGQKETWKDWESKSKTR
jgi:hypothetical protein